MKKLTTVIATILGMSTANAQIFLSQVYQNHNMTIGAAVEPEQLTNPLLAHFNVLVAENAMKPAFIHPSENEWNFDPADSIANYARQHNMKLRGHTFVWYRSTPDWMFIDNGKPASKSLVLARLRTHIETMMKRYGDVVHDWDVVNEVVDPQQIDCYRHDRWYNLFGPEYIQHAFGIARAVDPTARLFMNDFNTSVPTKLSCMVKVISQLKSMGTPIDGVGHQTHINIYYPPINEVDASLSTFERLGLINQITEIDISLYKYQETSLHEPVNSLLNKQAELYKQMFGVFIKHKVQSVTFWGVSDARSWLSTSQQEDFPLLFDKNGNPKPAFWAVQHTGQ